VQHCIWRKQFSLVINDKEAVNTPAESCSPDERHELLREQNQAVIDEAIGAGLLNPEHGDTIN
jgi:hypothetical protein